MRALVLAGCLAAAAPAHADDARVAGRLAAEKLAREGDRTHDLAQYAACGQAYIDLYNQDPEATDNDEVLYNAAACFDKAKVIGPALQSYVLIGKYYPRSRIAMKALFASAEAYARVAYFDRAAERFEEYAKKYAGEKDAVDALEQAIAYRTGIGDVDKQIDDIGLFIRMYGRVRPKQAAAARYTLVSVYQRSPESEAALLRSYLKTYETVIDDDQAIVARVRLADLLWASACPVHAIDGLCVKLVIDRPGIDRRCGPSTIVRVDDVPRTSAKQEALDTYRDAVARFEHAAPSSLTAAGRHAAAMAKLALADDQLERMIEASTFPKDLDLGPRSMKKLTAWLATSQQLGTTVDHAYSEVLALKDPESAIAAAARLGQTAEVMWRALLVGAIPGAVRGGRFGPEKVQAYCEQMASIAEPLAARAAESFATCAAKAGELGVSGAWPDLCWHEGALVAPARFPPARELHAEPAPSALPLAIERP